MKNYKIKRLLALLVSVSLICQGAFVWAQGRDDAGKEALAEEASESGEGSTRGVSEAEDDGDGGEGESQEPETISINKVEVADNGYGSSRVNVYLNLEGDDYYFMSSNYETRFDMEFMITEGEFAGETVYGQKESSSDHYIIDVPTAGKSAKGYAYIYTSDENDPLTPIELDRSEEVSMTPADPSALEFGITVTPRVNKAEVEFDFGPTHVADDQNYLIHYRKKGADKYESSGLSTNYSNSTYLNDLEPGTEYEYFGEAYASYYDPTNSHNPELESTVKYVGSESAPLSFSTKPNTVFTKSDFDEILYDYLLRFYGYIDGNPEDLTAADVQEVTSISRCLTGIPEDFAPFKTLKGIEKLVDLDSLILQNNDITDIKGVEKLSKLDYLDLRGNLLESIPDLSGLDKLSNIDLSRNYLTKDTLTKEKLPTQILSKSGYEDEDLYITHILDAQMKEFDIAAPTVYFGYGSGKYPFFIKAAEGKEPRGGKQYVVEVTIDGKTMTTETGGENYDYKDTYDSIWRISDITAKGVSVKSGDKKKASVKVTQISYGDVKNVIYEGDVNATFSDGSDFEYVVLSTWYFEENPDPQYTGGIYPQANVHFDAPLGSMDWLESGKYSFEEAYSNIKLLDSEGNSVPLKGKEELGEERGLMANLNTYGTTDYRYGHDFDGLSFDDTDKPYMFVVIDVYPKAKLAPGLYSICFDCEGKTTVMKDIIVVEDEDGNVPGKDSSSSSIKNDSSSSSGGNGSIDPGSPSENKSSSSSSGKSDSSSSEHKGDSSSSEQKSDSSSSERTDGGSSSEQKSDSSSTDKKDSGSSSAATEIQKAAESAKEENRAAAEDTVKLSGTDPRKLVLELTDSTPAVITVVKGNKFTLTGDANSFKLKNIGDKKCVNVKKNGQITAKKATPEAGATIEFTQNDQARTVIVHVKEPAATKADANKGVDKMKGLSVSVKNNTEFDVAMDIPLNAVFDFAKNSSKNNTYISDLKAEIGADGKYHFTGKSVKKGTSKIPFTVYGKKFTLKITVLK